MLAILLGPEFDPNFGKDREDDRCNMYTNKMGTRPGNTLHVTWDNSTGAKGATNQVIELRPINGILSSRLGPFQQPVASTKSLFKTVDQGGEQCLGIGKQSKSPAQNVHIQVVRLSAFGD